MPPGSSPEAGAGPARVGLLILLPVYSSLTGTTDGRTAKSNRVTNTRPGLGRRDAAGMARQAERGAGVAVPAGGFRALGFRVLGF